MILCLDPMSGVANRNDEVMPVRFVRENLLDMPNNLETIPLQLIPKGGPRLH
jgi:hypothetical protein